MYVCVCSWMLPCLKVLLRESKAAGESVYLVFVALAGVAALLLPIETAGRALEVSILEDFQVFYLFVVHFFSVHMAALYFTFQIRVELLIS